MAAIFVVMSFSEAAKNGLEESGRKRKSRPFSSPLLFLFLLLILVLLHHQTLAGFPFFFIPLRTLCLQFFFTLCLWDPPAPCSDWNLHLTLEFIWFYWVLRRSLRFTRFYRVLLGFTGFTGFYWVLLGFTGFYQVFLSFTGFY